MGRRYGTFKGVIPCVDYLLTVGSVKGPGWDTQGPPGSSGRSHHYPSHKGQREEIVLEPVRTRAQRKIL